MLLVLTATRARKSAGLLAPQSAAPEGGAKAKYKSAQPAYQTSVIPRPVLKLVVGIRFPLRRSWYSACPKGMRIATSLVPRSRDGGSAA